MIRHFIFSLLLGTMATISAAQDTAQDPTPEQDPAPEQDQSRGPVTNLPLPRFVSLKASEANIRRGPSTTHRIDWIFKRRDMPLEITAEHGHWRRVRDRDGAGGWIHYTLLSGVRTVLIEEDMLDLHARATEDSPVVVRMEQGVVARINECQPDWCKIRSGGYDGWAPKSALWGVNAGEILD